MLKFILPAFLCLALAGCGTYRPLYGKGPNGTTIASAITALSVNEQRTRGGQLLRNELLDGTSATTTPRYNVKLNVTESTTDIAFLSSTLGGRKRYNLSAEFNFYDATTGKLLNSGTSFSNVEYDVINVPVSDLSAADNARSRAAKELGQDIKLRLAAFLSSLKG